LGRWAWIITLLAIAIMALLVAAWIDAGSEPMRLIEQPLPLRESDA
jgi:hypothetical protein